jgi:predicted nucleic acid-binding protein
VAYYVDTSALVKLVVAEPESAGLVAWLADDAREPIACDLVRTELMRAVRRAAPERVQRAREVLESVTLCEVTSAVFDAAGRLEPTVLRSLDAIHLASALDLGDDLEGVVTYDERLAHAATMLGLAVVAPG